MHLIEYAVRLSNPFSPVISLDVGNAKDLKFFFLIEKQKKK